MTDLQSSAKQMGEVVTQIVTSITGVKKTVKGVRTETIEQGQFTKFKTTNNRLVMFNDANVFCVEVFSEED